MTSQVEFWLQMAAYVSVFLGALVAFDAIGRLMSRNETRADARNRRLRVIAKGVSTEDRLGLVKNQQNWPLLGSVPVLGNLPKALAQAGLTITPTVFLGVCLSAAVAIALLGALVVPVAVSATFGLAVAVAVPLMTLRQRQKHRVALLVKQLPDALDLMARGLRVGHPVSATIASVANDMADPVASEFGLMVDQIAYGDTLVDAFSDFAERFETEDARYLAVAIAIQNGTGGDLAQVLQTLAKVIRDRMTMRRKIVAVSAEGRLTSLFLSALPVFIFLSTSISAPGYYTGVMDDPLFRPFAITVLGLVITNFVVMRRLVNFRF